MALTWEIRNEATEVWLVNRDAGTEELIGSVLRQVEGADNEHHIWLVTAVEGNFSRQSTILEAAVQRFCEEGFILPELREQRRRLLVDLHTRIAITAARLEEVRHRVLDMMLSQPGTVAEAREDIADAVKVDDSLEGYIRTQTIRADRAAQVR